MPELKCLSGTSSRRAISREADRTGSCLMDMLVGIEVGRIATDQPAEVAQLTLQFLGDDRMIIERNNPVYLDPDLAVVGPFAEIEVEAQD